MMTTRQRQTLYALLDQAAANGGTLDDLAKRIGAHGRGTAHNMVSGLEARGLYRRAKGRKRPAFSAAAFKFIPVGDLPAPDE